MNVATRPEAMTAPPVPKLSPARAWFTVAILLLLYIFSFVDRQILTLLVKPIQADLGIGDFRMGLLLGPAFGLFYAICGVFMGRLVDRFPVRGIVGSGVACWGLATSLGGFARSFAGLFACRFGVGVGESVLTPAAHVIIAENFPPRRLSLAMAVFSSGVFIGSSLALAIGGLVIHLVGNGAVNLPLLGSILPWNMVLLLIGLTTLLITPIVLLLPNRRSHHGMAAGVANASAEPREGLWQLVRREWRIFLLMPFGFGCTNVVVNANFAWIPALLERSYGWEPARIGAALAVQHLVCGLAGQIGMAMLADRLYARGMADAHVKVQIGSLLISIPLLAIGLLGGSAWLLLALSAPFIILSFPFLGYANAGLQLRTPSHLRGQVSALFLAIVTIVGTLLGAPLSGLLSGSGFMGPRSLAVGVAGISVLAALAALICLTVVARALRAEPARAPR